MDLHLEFYRQVETGLVYKEEFKFKCGYIYGSRLGLGWVEMSRGECGGTERKSV